jgi:hypothetical protein
MISGNERQRRIGLGLNGRIASPQFASAMVGKKKSGVTAKRKPQARVEAMA